MTGNNTSDFTQANKAIGLSGSKPPKGLCKDFIIHVNKRLSNTKIKIEYIVESDESKEGKNARRI